MLKQLSLAAALAAILAGAGFAAPVVTTGKGVMSVVNVSDTVPDTISSDKDTDFIRLVGAAKLFNVTSPDDLFTVTFTAETQCRDAEGPATGWCAVRIVATQGASTVVIFNPNAAISGVNIRDSAFDSNPTGISNVDELETHSITQSARLPAGQWVIRVQRAIEVTVGSTSFLLDNWNLKIIQTD